MTADQCSTFIDAIKAQGLNDYTFVTDMNTNLYNNDHAIIKQNGDLLVNIKKPQFQTTLSMNGVEMIIADLSDVHEGRVMGSAEDIAKIAEAMGTALSDDEIKITQQMDKKALAIKPITGNYSQFVYLTEDKYNLLSDEDKAKYDEAKKFEGPLPNSFKVISKLEYDMMTTSEQAEYDELKALYEEKKSKYLGQNQAASISTR